MPTWVQLDGGRSAFRSIFDLVRVTDFTDPIYLRIDAVSRPSVDGPLRVLELHRPEVRSAVLAGSDAKVLFESTTARIY